MRTLSALVRTCVAAAVCSPLFGAALVFLSPATRVVPETAGNAELEIRRRDDLSSRVTIDFATADGTAIAGLKYSATSGTVIFEPGETNKTILIPILDDAVLGPSEDFKIRSNPTLSPHGAEFPMRARTKLTSGPVMVPLMFTSARAVAPEATV